MNAKTDKVVNVGYSPKLASPDRAWAFPEHADRRNHANMVELCKSSDMFGPLQPSYIAASVGCGHLIQSLYAVESQCR